MSSHLIGGSYMLTRLLQPHLEASAAQGRNPRVIYVTSGGMLLSKMPTWEVATDTAMSQ